ncbi:hypothetical protein [Pseudomonas zeae]|uniref:Uncharacterized protein n=1 Tax=Pseudomonas zeae TaxID=2745510 RepID=A0A9E6NJI7_9PSED|nr:hypothetical protein [Pseudomonas zeae]QXI09154.1 hypothetical protein HU754_014930 [Pseudomonas zeae]
MKQPPKARTVLAHLLFWGVLLSLLAIVLTLAAFEGSSNIQEWNTWRQSNQSALLIWRVPLYAVTVYGWYRMRLSLIKRGFTRHQHKRLLYAEVAAIAALALLELLNFRPD